MGSGAGTIGDITLNTTLNSEERAKFQNSKVIKELLKSANIIAIVGLSTEKTKASNMVASYLQDEGYTIVPIHPKAEEILGEKCYPNLSSVPFQIDVVDVFRPPHEVEKIVEEAIRIKAKAVWTQLKLTDLQASQKALDAGLISIADKCIKMEHGRFGGQLHWAGMNTEVISAKRR